MSEALLYGAVVPYESIRQRPQWLADGLAREQCVLYLEPNASPLRGHLAAPRLTPVGPNFARFEPGTALPLSGYWRPVNRINQARVARRTRAALEELGWKASRLLVSFPKHVDLLDHFPGVPVVYDVMDDYPAFFSKREGAVLRRMHRELLQRATQVVASSRSLLDQCAEHTRQAPLLIENAVPEAFLQHASSATGPEFPRPCFGYVGALASWIDMEAVRSLAEAWPEGSVVLVGPQHSRLPRLPANVHLLGERPHAELPALLAAMDIGLVPFQVNQAMDAVNPVKVYEYLAAGVPVLATPCAELRRFTVGVHIASAQEWPGLARRILAEESDPEALRASVREHTWEARAKRLGEWLATPDASS